MNFVLYLVSWAFLLGCNGSVGSLFVWRKSVAFGEDEHLARNGGASVEEEALSLRCSRCRTHGQMGQDRHSGAQR